MFMDNLLTHEKLGLASPANEISGMLKYFIALIKKINTVIKQPCLLIFKIHNSHKDIKGVATAIHGNILLCCATLMCYKVSDIDFY